MKNSASTEVAVKPSKNALNSAVVKSDVSNLSEGVALLSKILNYRTNSVPDDDGVLSDEVPGDDEEESNHSADGGDDHRRKRRRRGKADKDKGNVDIIGIHSKLKQSQRLKRMEK